MKTIFGVEELGDVQEEIKKMVSWLGIFFVIWLTVMILSWKYLHPIIALMITLGGVFWSWISCQEDPI